MSEVKDWPDPTAEMLATAEFDAVWEAIKRWDIETEHGDGRSGATGNHVRAILDALQPVLREKETELVVQFAGYISVHDDVPECGSDIEIDAKQWTDLAADFLRALHVHPSHALHSHSEGWGCTDCGRDAGDPKLETECSGLTTGGAE